MRFGLGSVIGVLLAAQPVIGATRITIQEPQTRPTFRTSVSRVAVAATVRDRRGRPVTNLTTQDFELIDSGMSRAIVEFRTESTPVNMAMLADFSGSMDVAEKRAAMREVARHLLSWLQPTDQVGLWSFDQYLDELQPFGPAPGQVLEKLSGVRPFGKTKLFDAIAEAGRRLAAEGGPRRAVVALTDGADNASRLTAAEVSAMASGIDVPVYIILVISPFDRADRSVIDEAALEAQFTGPLGDLARWTGGEIFAAIGPAATSQAARQIVTELRHQYLIAFEPSTEPGWHPITLRTRDKNLTVRARSGYIVRNGSTGL
jgi:Ca-activated chloride channel family protein